MEVSLRYQGCCQLRSCGQSYAGVAQLPGVRLVRSQVLVQDQGHRLRQEEGRPRLASQARAGEGISTLGAAFCPDAIRNVITLRLLRRPACHAVAWLLKSLRSIEDITPVAHAFLDNSCRTQSGTPTLRRTPSSGMRSSLLRSASLSLVAHIALMACQQ